MATKRLIDANALLDEVDVSLHNNPHTDAMVRATHKHEHNHFMVMIMQAPTVDAVEVVHGRWEKSEHHGFLCCSECKDVYISDEWQADGKWNFCPNCGAKMDGDGE